MKKQNLLWMLFAVLVLIFAVSNISVKLNEKKKAPEEQHIQEAFITVTAPHLERNQGNEQSSKDALKKNIKNILFFQATYKDADYTLIYAEYPKEANLQNGIDSVINLFKDSNFDYKASENEVSGNKGMFIEGTFDRNGKKFGLKEQLIKKDKHFWQLLVVYPVSKKNTLAADNYIKSAVLDKDIKKQEKKK